LPRYIRALDTSIYASSTSKPWQHCVRLACAASRVSTFCAAHSPCQVSRGFSHINRCMSSSQQDREPAGQQLCMAGPMSHREPSSVCMPRKGLAARQSVTVADAERVWWLSEWPQQHCRPVSADRGAPVRCSRADRPDAVVHVAGRYLACVGGRSRRVRALRRRRRLRFRRREQPYGCCLRSHSQRIRE